MKQDDRHDEESKWVRRGWARFAISIAIFTAFGCGALVLFHIYQLIEQRTGIRPDHRMMTNSYLFVGSLVACMSASIMAVGRVIRNVLASRMKEVEKLIALRESLESEVSRRTATLQQEVIGRTNLQARFVAAIGLMQDAFVISDQDGVIEFVNKAAGQIFRYPAAEMTGMNINQLLPKKERKRHDQKLHEYRETGMSRIIGKGRDEGLSACRSDGSLFPVGLLIDKIETADGVFFTAIVSDLTEKNKWITFSRRMTAIVEHANDCIVVLGANGAIEYVNPEFERQFGYASSELLGKQSDAFGWQRSDDDVYEAVTKALSSGERWSGQMRSQSRGGNLLEHDASFSPIYKEDQSISGYVYIGRNITEAVKMQLQLNQAQKLESIGQLAAGIAHEINTPTQYVGDNTTFLQEAYTDLGVMIATIEELVAGDSGSVPAELLVKAMNDADVNYLKEEIPRAIEQSLEGISRVSTIVRAMKEFSHPSEKKTMVDLNKAIKSTITVAKNEWKYVAEMNTDLDAALPPVNCLPGDMNQVVLNIIVNAAHAIAEKLDEASGEKGAISVSTRSADQWAEIRIEDTGAGMPEDVKLRIFDPFYTTKEVGKGTGQGLSIAHAVIVEKHAGTIEVDSTPGQGTAFTIRIPIEDTSPAEAAA